MKILIVDDSRAMRFIVARALRQAGFDAHEIRYASNGREALEAIEASAPDLVLCDWNMPEMSGMELLEALNERGLKRRFGFVTSESNSAQRKQALEAGADFILGKPFTPEKLGRTLAPLMR